MQCNSQKPEQNLKPKLESSTGKIADADYFVGKWQNTKTYHLIAGKKVLQSASKCNQKSYWKFIKDKGVLKHSHFTATGDNCERFASEAFGTVNLHQNQMTYVISDMVFSVKINILSKDEFVLMTKELDEGEMVEVELIYTKMK